MYNLSFLLCLSVITASVAELPNEIKASVAWFTNASIENSVRMESPKDPLPVSRGTFGDGVNLTHAVPLDSQIIKRDKGMISFWIRPNWNGNDGKEHILLRIGDPDVNGVLVEKAQSGMLRYVMSSPEKTAVARADVSQWEVNEWHQIVIVWMSNNDKPLGTVLWIDKVAVAGPIASGNTFLDPEKMDDNRIWIGEKSSNALMDELIIRNELRTELSPGQIDVIYRDYFRTAPYESIEIDPEPSRI